MSPQIVLDNIDEVTMSLFYVLERGTSPVDWCEANYSHHPSIAELANTVSNLLFLLFPPILCALFRQYANNIDRGIYVVWALFAWVGVCSAYFHATLSLLGQLMDELAILWLLIFAFGMWLPRDYFPRFLYGNRRKFKFLIVSAGVVASIAACVKPWINSFALMSIGVPTIVLLYLELARCGDDRVVRLGKRCSLVWACAVTAWIADRMFCDTWSAVNLPYLHGVWHILIAIASYTVCVLFAYFNARLEHAHLHPTIRFWPTDDFELGIPYIELKNAPL